MPAVRSARTASAVRAASCERCIQLSTRSSNDCAPSETRLMPAARQARAASSVTSSGFASSVTSTASRAAGAWNASNSTDRSAASAAGGKEDGVPPPRYRVSSPSSLGAARPAVRTRASSPATAAT